MIELIAPATSPTPQAAADKAKLAKVAQQFEAVFVRQTLKSMRAASLGDGIFDSTATEQFRDMADAKTADAMAAKGMFGVADLLVKHYGARVVAPLAGTR